MYVYRFKNSEGNIIYIGKAEDLKSMLNHHNHLPTECYDEISLIEYSKFNNSDEMSIYWEKIDKPIEKKELYYSYKIKLNKDTKRYFESLLKENDFEFEVE